MSRSVDQPEKVNSAQVALGDERSTGNPRCWSLRNWLVGVVDVPGRERGDIENRLTLVVGSHRGRGPATCIEFCEDTKQNTSHIMFNRRDKNEKHTFSLLFSWIRALHD